MWAQAHQKEIIMYQETTADQRLQLIKIAYDITKQEGLPCNKFTTIMGRNLDSLNFYLTHGRLLTKVEYLKRYEVENNE